MPKIPHLYTEIETNVIRFAIVLPALIGLHLHDGGRERIAMTHTHITCTHVNVLKCCFMYLPHFDYFNLFPCIQRKIVLILRKFQQYLENGIDFKSKLFKMGMVYFMLNLSFFPSQIWFKEAHIFATYYYYLLISVIRSISVKFQSH